MSIANARQLRKNLTDAEKKLWNNEVFEDVEVVVEVIVKALEECG